MHALACGADGRPYPGRAAARDQELRVLRRLRAGQQAQFAPFRGRIQRQQLRGDQRVRAVKAVHARRGRRGKRQVGERVQDLLQARLGERGMERLRRFKAAQRDQAPGLWNGQVMGRGQRYAQIGVVFRHATGHPFAEGKARMRRRAGQAPVFQIRADRSAPLHASGLPGQLARRFGIERGIHQRVAGDARQALLAGQMRRAYPAVRQLHARQARHVQDGDRLGHGRADQGLFRLAPKQRPFQFGRAQLGKSLVDQGQPCFLSHGGQKAACAA